MFSDFKKALPMSGLDLFPPRWIGDRARQLELVMRPHQPLPLAPSTLLRPATGKIAGSPRGACLRCGYYQLVE